MEYHLYAFLLESLYRCAGQHAGRVSNPLFGAPQDMGAATIVRASSVCHCVPAADGLLSELNLTLYHEILILILQLLVAGESFFGGRKALRADHRFTALMSLRTYALYNRALPITAVLCVSVAVFSAYSVVCLLPGLHVR